MNGISCWTGASPYLQKGFVLFRVHCYISTLPDCKTVRCLITFMFCTFCKTSISVDSSSLDAYLFYFCDALFIPLNYYYFNFFPVWCTLTSPTAPHPIPSILSLITISLNRIIFWILRCHHAERENKFNRDTTGVELQQRLWCTWSLYIATLHKCGIPPNV